MGGRALMPTPQGWGRSKTYLQVGMISLPQLRSRHKYPSQSLGGKFMDIIIRWCPPHIH
jgi:hypothetical protein